MARPLKIRYNGSAYDGLVEMTDSDMNTMVDSMTNPFMGLSGTQTTSGSFQINGINGGQQFTDNSIEFWSDGTSTGYNSAAIEIRESNRSANSSATPPHIGMHWGGIVASNIALESNGTIAIRDNPGSGYENFKARDASFTRNLTVSGTGNVAGTLTCEAIVANGNITVNANDGASYLYMGDTDEGSRSIHNNSNRIGFLTSAGSWGAYCTDDGDWHCDTGDMYATRFNGQATSAKYADLAENYTADGEYAAGVVLAIGGDAEVTEFKSGMTLAGVVSDKPAYLMNSELEDGVAVALKGRVPCNIEGSCVKGDYIIAGDNGKGTAVSKITSFDQQVIGVALADATDTVEIKV